MGRTLQKPSRSQAASEPLPDFSGLTGLDERLAHDSERTRVIREDIRFALMEVAVEGSLRFRRDFFNLPAAVRTHATRPEPSFQFAAGGETV